MLALTWTPGFCATHPGAAATDECARPTPWSRANLSLHGLWPQWDSYCYRGPRPEKECRDWARLPGPWIGDPSVRRRLATVMPGMDTHLDRHEWAKHGTCSGLTADAYFGLAEALADQVNRLGLPKLIADRARSSGMVTARELCDAVRADLGESGANALQIEAKQGADGRLHLIGVWLSLADGADPLAIDGAHLRVNANRICGRDEGGSYVVDGASVRPS